jgi:hypothetical protein
MNWRECCALMSNFNLCLDELAWITFQIKRWSVIEIEIRGGNVHLLVATLLNPGVTRSSNLSHYVETDTAPRMQCFALDMSRKS